MLGRVQQCSHLLFTFLTSVSKFYLSIVNVLHYCHYLYTCIYIYYRNRSCFTFGEHMVSPRVTHLFFLCCVFLFCLSSLCACVSRDYPFVIAPSVFSCDHFKQDGITCCPVPLCIQNKIFVNLPLLFQTPFLNDAIYLKS